MNASDLKLIIGEVVLENFEKDSNEGNFPDHWSQKEQQAFFDECVQGFHEAFISNKNLMNQLTDADKQDIKQYFAEKYENARKRLGFKPKS